jgi:hypothetical protein
MYMFISNFKEFVELLHGVRSGKILFDDEIKYKIYHMLGSGEFEIDYNDKNEIDEFNRIWELFFNKSKYKKEKIKCKCGNVIKFFIEPEKMNYDKNLYEDVQLMKESIMICPKCQYRYRILGKLMGYYDF